MLRPAKIMPKIRYVLPNDCQVVGGTNQGFEAKEFPLNDPEGNVAKITLSKPYPESEDQRCVNTRSKMTIMINHGSVTVISPEIEGGRAEIPAGSALLIPQNVAYRFVPVPEVSMAIFSTPPWTKEQQSVITVSDK